MGDHPADTDLSGLPDGQVHAEVANDGPQQVLPIHQCRGCALLLHHRLAVFGADSRLDVLYVHVWERQVKGQLTHHMIPSSLLWMWRRHGRTARPLTHPVQPVAVVPPVVSLHQHLGQAAGMIGLGAHRHHAPLDKTLHLGLRDQTSAQEQGRHFSTFLDRNQTSREGHGVTFPESNGGKMEKDIFLQSSVNMAPRAEKERTQWCDCVSFSWVLSHTHKGPLRPSSSSVANKRQRSKITTRLKLD